MSSSYLTLNYLLSLLFVKNSSIIPWYIIWGKEVLKMKISSGAKKAILIGSLCSFSYLAVYIARNILSAVTPQLIAAGYSETYVGKISSLFLI